MSLVNNTELINKLMDCSGCTCCDAGTVYVFPREVKELRLNRVEVIETFGFHFIPEGKNGCLYNDPARKKCTIYKYRPICCRLFPFDIYLPTFSQKLFWVYYKKCQNIVEILRRVQNTRIVFDILNEIERDMSDEDILDFYNMSIITRRIERGENVMANYGVLKPLRYEIDQIMRQRFFRRAYYF